MSVHIEAYIQNFKKTLDPFLLEYLRKLALTRVESVQGLHALLREAVKGGKCIRGALVKLGYEIAADCPADERLLPVAAAIEVAQTGFLAHDDIIDKSPLRRGRDALWRAAACVGKEDDAHYGVSQAICLGDAAIILTDKLIAESAFEADRKIKVLKVFHGVALKTVDGEMLDALLSRGKSYLVHDRGTDGFGRVLGRGLGESDERFGTFRRASGRSVPNQGRHFGRSGRRG